MNKLKAFFGPFVNFISEKKFFQTAFVIAFTAVMLVMVKVILNGKNALGKPISMPWFLTGGALGFILVPHLYQKVVQRWVARLGFRENSLLDTIKFSLLLAIVLFVLVDLVTFLVAHATT